VDTSKFMQKDLELCKSNGPYIENLFWGLVGVFIPTSVWRRLHSVVFDKFFIAHWNT